MRLTARQLNRATLARQMLLDRQSFPVADAVHRVVALQAQEPVSPYIALWNRLDPFDPPDLDRAFAERTIVKATLLRITLHAVHATDHRAFLEAMEPSLRASCLDDPRFTRAGLSVDQVEAVIPDLVAFGATPRTNAEIERWLDERFGELPKASVWWALRRFIPFVHAPTGAPWTFGPRPSYVAATEQPWPGDRDAAVRHLAVRYLEGFGPASARDLAQFSTKYIGPPRAALDALAEDLVRLEGPDGTELFDVHGGPVPPEDSPAPPRLMAMWDSLLLAHVDRSRFIPPAYRKLVLRSNGDVLPTLLVDGLVAGVWRTVGDGIEATAFHRLDDGAWAALELEAGGLVALLADREPQIYRRHTNWWTDMPSAEVRVLGGGG